MMSGQAHIDMAVRATKLGALDFLEKPISTDKLLLTVENVLKLQRLESENRQLRQRLGKHEIIWTGETMKKIMAQVERVAASETRVCILGETGTGKELIARALHFHSLRGDQPWIDVNCGALPEHLVESELFGYEKGAFSGADNPKPGFFELASKGTLFLDEVGELPLELQAKLLRVLQEKEVRPVGSNQRVKVDVRVIAATNRDLEAAYKNGTFRKDLYFRLNVVTLFVPALRERRSDTPMLVHWFLERYAPGQEMHVTSAAMKALMQYDWPGNVRELENCVERAVALGNGQGIDLGDLPPSIASGGAAAEPETRKTAILDPDLGGVLPAREMPRHSGSTTDLEDIERATIQRVFEQVKGDKALAGRMLGISRATLYRKLKRYNIGMSAQAAAAHSLQ